MASLKSFTEQNPNLIAKSGGAAAGAKELTINVAILSIADQRVEMLYEGTRFSVSPDDVVDIESTNVPGGAEGRPAIIKLKGDAIVIAVNAVPAAQLAPGLPFAFRSQGPVIPMVRPPAEEAWRLRVGYPASRDFIPTPDASLAAAAASGCQATCYWCYSDENCGWIYDRTIADD